MVELPAALLERMAQAIAESADDNIFTNAALSVERWNHVRDMYRRQARAAAAALLDGCEVRVEWGADHAGCAEHWNIATCEEALRQWYETRPRPGWRLVKRTVITYTGPAEPVVEENPDG